MNQKKSAFTLIELLVVIAIIGLLLAIILPSLKIAKERAQFIICKTNLKSYGLVMKLYLNENDDGYPECQTSMFDGTSSGIPLNCQWHAEEISPAKNPEYAGPLWSYMETMDAHMCTTFKKFAKALGEDHTGHNAGSPPVVPQYAFSQNAFLGRDYGALKESQVVNTAETLVWVEETIWKIVDDAGKRWADYELNDTCFFSRHFKDGANFGDFIATYHGTSISKPNDGEGNAVFVDGHVALIDPYYEAIIPGGVARAGFIYSWPLKGKRSPDMKY